VDATGWDLRYAGSELVWGSEPNRFVAEELTALPPGRALDVACGEGRNAIWLATRGWHATGADFSAAAVERARRLAASAGVADRTEFVVADVVSGQLPGGFDAVVVAYLQLPAVERQSALRRAAAALAPGGTLLVVAHDLANLTEGVGGPQDARVLYTADDVLADLAGLALVVEKAQPVRRSVQTDDGEREAIDALVRVRRTG